MVDRLKLCPPSPDTADARLARRSYELIVLDAPGAFLRRHSDELLGACGLEDRYCRILERFFALPDAGSASVLAELEGCAQSPSIRVEFDNFDYHYGKFLARQLGHLASAADLDEVVRLCLDERASGGWRSYLLHHALHGPLRVDVTPLAGQLASRAPLVADAALFTLRAQGGRDVALRLLSELPGPDEGSACRVFEAVAAIKDAAVKEACLGLLPKTRSERTRTGLLSCLAKLGGDDVVSLLADAVAANGVEILDGFLAQYALIAQVIADDDRAGTSDVSRGLALGSARGLGVASSHPLVWQTRDGARRFLLHTACCADPACPGLHLVFREVLGEGPTCCPGPLFKLNLDMDTWQEERPAPRPPGEALLVDKFLAEVAEDAPFQAELRSRVRSAREALARPDTFALSPDDVRAGLLLPYADVPGHEPATFALPHAGRLFVIEDLYCADPACRCEKAELHFVAVGDRAAPASQTQAFAATLTFGGKVFVDRVVGLHEADARSMVALWRRSQPDLLTLLRSRYDEVKELGRRALGPEAPPPPAPPSRARVGRNDPCPCGSGKKFKKCCGGGNG